MIPLLNRDTTTYQPSKVMKYISTNSRPFFWLQEIPRRSVGFVTHFHPDHQHHVESKMYHKSQSEKQIC